MKGLKLRAWNEDDQEMIYLENSGLQYYDFEGGYSLGFTVDGYSGFWAHEQYESASKKANVFPVMEFTGLRDRNETDIYECDILQWFSSNGNAESAEMVMHSLDWDGMLGNNAPFMSAWGTTCGRYYKTFMNIYDPVRYSEVIGNIYANPALIPILQLTK